MSFVDALRHASIAHHTKDQLRSILLHRRQPTLLGFTKHLLEYKHVHDVVAKPIDLFSDDIAADLRALDPDLYFASGYESDYALDLPKKSLHLQGTHWYILSCAHASGGAVISDAVRFSSRFLRKRDLKPIREAFEEWTIDWTPDQKDECLAEIPEIFERASKINDMMYF